MYLIEVFLIISQLLSIISSDNSFNILENEVKIYCNLVNNIMNEKDCKDKLSKCVNKSDIPSYNHPRLCIYLEFMNIIQDHYCLNTRNRGQCNKIVIDCTGSGLLNTRKCIEKNLAN